MIRFRQKGDFKNTEKFLYNVKKMNMAVILDRYGRMGVEALRANTPVDTGLTASSWNYEISTDRRNSKITWVNNNTQSGVNIAIILQYGHTTGTGGYVQGRDFINPAIQPIMDKIANDVWKEVSSL